MILYPLIPAFSPRGPSLAYRRFTLSRREKGAQSFTTPAAGRGSERGSNKTIRYLRTRLCALLVLIVGVVMAPAVIAAPDDLAREYEIELLIFRNLVQNDAGEVWPVDFSDWFEEEPVDNTDISEPLDPPPRAVVTWLPKSQFRLTAQRNALARSAPYRPIAHLAWRQAVPGRRQAKALELPGGQHNPDRAYVDGLVRVAVERYLHLDLDLRLHLPDSAIQVAPQDNQAVPEDYQDQTASQDFGVPDIRLRQQRRMRSKELHYFDHPRFGVIALITPYEPVEVPPETDIPTDTDIPASAQP